MKFSTQKLLLASAVSLALTACGGGGGSSSSDSVFGTTDTASVSNPSQAVLDAQLAEANLIVALGASEANRTVEDFNGSDRSFRDELNVFIPSAIDVDEENLRDNTKANVTLPIYEGVGPEGNPTYFIITEAATQEAAEAFGAILSPKLRYGALPSAAAAAQRVEVNEEGRIIFRGDVDFSPVRDLAPAEGSDIPDENGNFPSAFPPSVAVPGAEGDDEYSSLVVLPSGLVINAQIIANATGIHDRIIFEETTDENGVVTNSFDADIAARQATFELLDGWQGGDRYYYHLVTDASDIGAATIEKGTYAPRLRFLPTFGDSSLDGESVLLGFSPNANGLTTTNDSINGTNRQSLSSTILDQDLDPVNVFPFDPTNNIVEGNNYSPFWDAHISQWTEQAIANGERRAITSFSDLSDLIDAGSVTSFSGSLPNAENEFLFGLRATGAVINCPVIMQPFEGETNFALTGAEEITLLATTAATEAGRDLADFTGANREFASDLNVFLPSTISIDTENLLDNEAANATLPLYRGIGPQGEDVYYILTETSTQETSDIAGTILAPKLRFGALPAAAAAAQQVTINDDGLMVFKGTVDFSFTRSITAGTGEAAFPPETVQPGGVGDAEYSSLVVLPSGLVVNAQIVSNATGDHDRILEIDTAARTATFQLLDGWQGGDRFFYHLVTDASADVPATIELGVFAPRMSNLPTFGVTELGDRESVLLGFSPNTNGLTVALDNADETNRQGLSSTILDNDKDPVNVFPFDPRNDVEVGNNYSPMWDAHLNQWSQAAIDGGLRRAITGFTDLENLINDGLVESFFGSPEDAIENDFLFGLRASNAVINCPVILQPFEGQSDFSTIATPLVEATAIATLGATEAARELADWNGTSRSFTAEENVFLPSAISVDDLRDNTLANVTLPLYEGIGPNGEVTYFIITEASTPETAEMLGAILAPNLSFANSDEAAAGRQDVQVMPNGRIIFKGDVDFSPVRLLEAGGTGANAFPPANAIAGSIGDDQYSSLVLLPSGTVINAQIVANSTGIHDRITEGGLDIENRTVNMELLDGWQGGDRYYYHLVTDASARVPATIEQGTFAPRMAALSSLTGDTSQILLGFSPNTNGLTEAAENANELERQGLASTIVDNDQDPVNVFPFDPDNSNTTNNNYSPMWNLHLNSWTQTAIDAGERRAITSFADLEGLIANGLVTSFGGSTGPENNDFLFGLRATNAIINCPVILQPFEGENNQNSRILPIIN